MIYRLVETFDSKVKSLNTYLDKKMKDYSLRSFDSLRVSPRAERQRVGFTEVAFKLIKIYQVEF